MSVKSAEFSRYSDKKKTSQERYFITVYIKRDSLLEEDKNTHNNNRIKLEI